MNMNVIEFVLSNGFSTDRELLGSPTVSFGARPGPGPREVGRAEVRGPRGAERERRRALQRRCAARERRRALQRRAEPMARRRAERGAPAQRCDDE